VRYPFKVDFVRISMRFDATGTVAVLSWHSFLKRCLIANLQWRFECDQDGRGPMGLIFWNGCEREAQVPSGKLGFRSLRPDRLSGCRRRRSNLRAVFG
jgi:hypothetical protein